MFMQLKDLCSSSVCERQMKKLKIIIDFETDILDELSQVGIMKSYTIEQTAGRVEMLKKTSTFYSKRNLSNVTSNYFSFPVHYCR